jgi:hypothetical protein
MLEVNTALNTMLSRQQQLFCIPEQHLFKHSICSADSRNATGVETMQLELRRYQTCGVLSISSGASSTTATKAAIWNNYTNTASQTKLGIELDVQETHVT